MDPSEELLASNESQPEQNLLPPENLPKTKPQKHIMLIMGIVVALFISVYSVVQGAKQLAFAPISSRVSSLARFLHTASIPTPTPIPTSAPTPTQTSSPIFSPTPTTQPTPVPQTTATPTPSPTSSAPTGLPTGIENTTTLNPRVLVIGYNPTENGVSVVDRYFSSSRYPNGQAIESSVFTSTQDAFSKISNNNITFSIVKTLHITSFPIYPDGFSYTIDSYKKCVYTDPAYDAQSCEQRKFQFDYSKWAQDNNICQIAKESQADEIWLLSPPYIMAWEAFMIGPNTGFDVNGANYAVPGCDRHYIVMDATYDRPDNMLHDIGHRVEATMRYLTQNWRAEDISNDWERFAQLSLYSGQKPGNAYCGNAHYPSNTTTAYDYSNSQTNLNSCNDWQNFPDFTNTTQTVSCSTSGCIDAGWQPYLPSY